MPSIQAIVDDSAVLTTPNIEKKNTKYSVGIEVMTAVVMKSFIFCDIIPCKKNKAISVTGRGGP
jgi:hypothetical protein